MKVVGMSRSVVSLTLSKYLFLIFFLTFIAISLSGCGEDAFTTDEPPADPQSPGTINAPGTGTTPPTTTTNVFFGVGSGTNFIQGVLDVGVTAPLSARGTTTITGYLIDDNGDPYTSPVEFEFTSTCIGNGSASIDSPVTSVNGVVRSTYRAEGCSGSDVIVATGTVGSNNLSASGSLTVQPASVGAIEFISAAPEVISLEGTAGLGLTESSTVTFRVVDNAGRPVAGATVNFSLSTIVGGITLDNNTGITAADGTVQVSVSSGTVNTSVRVVASADTGTAIVTTQSVALAISTGVPDDDSFQIAATALRPSAWECNGEEVTITAFAADQFNNPAPDGTAIAFQTEGGFIEGSCTTVDGECSVVWTSNAPRPTDDFGTPGLAGRVTILATVIGEESFIDAAPSNGRFDNGEGFTDLGEAFVDINENNVRDTFEEYTDFNGNGAYDGPDGNYNGVLCSTGATQCSTDSPLLTVSDEIVLVMASRDQNLTAYQNGDLLVPGVDSILLPDDGSAVFITLEFADPRGQQPPTDSSISVSTSTGEIVGGNTTDITDGNAQGPFSFTVAIRATGNNLEPGVLTATLNMPGSACDGGLTVDYSIPITIADVTSPSVTNSTPADGDTNVAIDSSISVTFNDNLNTGTVNATNIILTGGGGAVPVSVSYNNAERRATIVPNAPLDNDTVYTLSLTSGVEDTDGNTLIPATIIFRTAPPPATP
jgi:hypothetical protein